VVVSREDLACLDLIIWLRTGTEAALRLGISQPKVSRAVQSVSDLFGITIAKKQGEWAVQGDQTLLNMERRVHQEYRWSKGEPLRIESQYYSGPLYLDPVPQRWVAGNFDYIEIHTPLHHLRNGVIDAWLGCYPDVPEDDDPDLCCFHLTRLPTHLVVSPDHPLLHLRHPISLEDVRHYPSLALPDNAFPKIQAALQRLHLWNNPQDLNRYDQQKWEGKIASDLLVGYATALSIGCLDQAKVILPISIPLEVGETLVVRNAYCNHPRLRQLLQHLSQKAADLAWSCSEIRLVGAAGSSAQADQSGRTKARAETAAAIG
jgi:DNA-binding transcriptional LysR family regulator